MTEVAAPASAVPSAATLDPKAVLTVIGQEMKAGRMVPFLGPEVLTLSGEASPVPVGARELSHLMTTKCAVPGRIRNNLWHSAQYIESHKHRVTVDRLMAMIFQPVPAPSELHRWLAGLTELPLIVDSWYDGTMRAALAGRDDWGQIQGASKARRLVDTPWTRAYDASGVEVSEPDAAPGWKTILYKPHGAAQPVGDVLVSDADYVEVLTDIDLQHPIPEQVRSRRLGRGFLFLGCRFYDQILRTFARQVIKRSGGAHYAVVPGDLTKNEVKFLETEGITPLPIPLPEAAAILAATA